MYQKTFYHLFFLFRLHSSAGIKMDVSHHHGRRAHLLNIQRYEPMVKQVLEHVDTLMGIIP